ncbi:GHMP kinase [Tamlana nanhaiensis]|uniref:GHMP kinase n=1 Tax=Neotamlana nanhaiensis TaxID=1382798 RepID=A0A0D7VX31_9FLAO|nr:GYDIA family GHMP kinase [Tamlana nanhaiensis]KJD31396.1 GHMP kinase [Tamlana nanhaiensis]
MKQFYSNGKLFIAGEYVVLDEALAFAVPTTYGQHLTVEPLTEPVIIWQSFDEQENIWFEATFNVVDGAIQSIVNTSIAQEEVTKRVIQILKAAKTLNPDFLNDARGFKVINKLTFPRHWGLGTSSTLINNIAQWAEVDAYKLLNHTFGGSGYDIACAQHDTPIIYQKIKDAVSVNRITFNPEFKSQLYFVYLNKKMNSRIGIATYNANKSNLNIPEINSIIRNMANCTNVADFEDLIEQHETIIAKLTNQTPVKTLLFKDFIGSVKSLGAWGGDFVLAVSKENPTEYFEAKGYETVIPYCDMVL